MAGIATEDKQGMMPLHQDGKDKHRSQHDEHADGAGLQRIGQQIAQEHRERETNRVNQQAARNCDGISHVQFIIEPTTGVFANIFLAPGRQRFILAVGGTRPMPLCLLYRKSGVRLKAGDINVQAAAILRRNSHSFS